MSHTQSEMFRSDFACIYTTCWMLRRLTVPRGLEEAKVLSHWWVKPGPRVSAQLLAGAELGPWSLAAWPRGSQSWCQITGVGQGAVSKTVACRTGPGYDLCWSARS